jgi:hypothetical protein
VRPPKRLRFSLATRQDGPELLALLAQQTMPGWVRLSFRRDPDFFLAADAEGREHQVLTARDEDTGALVAMHERCVQPAYVDGAVQRVGYLGGLRVDTRLPAGRWRVRLMREGFAAGRELLRREDETRFDLTAIVHDNRAARRLLEKGLPGLPRYTPAGEWLTLALRTRSVEPPRSPLRARAATPADGAMLLALLRRHNRRQQLAPAWSTPDLGRDGQELLLAERAGEVLGCAAIWDQRAFRQVVVRGYRRPLGALRPALNAVAPLLGVPHLPAPGSTLALGWLSHLALAEQPAAVAVTLVGAALGQARRRGLEQLLLGLPPDHPAVPALARHFRPLRYRSMLYLVHWHEERVRLPDPDLGPMHPETALL